VAKPTDSPPLFPNCPEILTPPWSVTTKGQMFANLSVLSSPPTQQPWIQWCRIRPRIQMHK